MADDPTDLRQLLSDVLRDLATASFGSRHEPNMHGVIELAMRNIHALGHRPSDPVVLLPANVTRVVIPGYLPDKVHVWELQTLTLLGMWQATNLNDDTTTADALRKLHEELVGLDEEDLLARPYRVWSSDLGAMQTRLVGSFLDSDPEIPQFLAVGGARVVLRQRQSTNGLESAL
jgi:hypothetical protein